VRREESGGHWPFEGHNFFIILNLAVGGNWPGYPDGSTQFPQQYIIDYVRVFEIDWSSGVKYEETTAATSEHHHHHHHKHHHN
jgi:beta-glucanase (GH16 family)